MKLQLLDGVNKMEFSFGLEETVGELIGESPVSLESKCIEIIWPLKRTVLGEFLRKILTLCLLNKRKNQLFRK